MRVLGCTIDSLGGIRRELGRCMIESFAVYLRLGGQQ